jgi:hypothetical protein
VVPLRGNLAAMALQTVFRITGKAGQWILAFGLLLAVLGLIAWLLAIFHISAQFLLNLGLLGRPVIFIGLLLVFIAALLQRRLIRRGSVPLR